MVVKRKRASTGVITLLMFRNICLDLDANDPEIKADSQDCGCADAPIMHCYGCGEGNWGLEAI